jgi:hypothetical protein
MNIIGRPDFVKAQAMRGPTVGERLMSAFYGRLGPRLRVIRAELTGPLASRPAAVPHVKTIMAPVPCLTSNTISCNIRLDGSIEWH